MEGDLDDCEFWLPPQFLTDDELLMDFKHSGNGNEGQKFSGSASGFGFGFSSGLTSPVESVVGSTETESDEDDYITGLTRKMAHSTLDELSHHYEASKAWGVSGSPKSPLCSGLVGYGSSRGSPRRGQPLSLSSSQALRQNEAAWNLLCAAAGEVSRMKRVEESAGFYPCRDRLVDHTRNPGPLSVRLENNGPNLGFSSNQPRLSYQQLQAAWFEQLKRQQLMKHHQQQANGIWGQGKIRGGQLNLSHLNQQMAQTRLRDGVAGERPVRLPMSSWPTLRQSQQPQPLTQPQPGSGMRAVFLGNPGAKRECAGTGVFLPRRIGSPTDARNNKPACSTVLVPDRVVHALNLSLDAVDNQPQVHYKHNPSFTPDYDPAMKYNKNLLRAQQRQNGGRPQPPVINHHHEARLPQEWTY